MEAKNKGTIPIALDPDQIEENFKVAEKPSPIFVEYKVMKEVFSPKLSWQRSGFSPGRYRLTNVSVKLAPTKASGKPWDAMGDDPDPLVSVFLDGVLIDTCFLKNQVEGSCSSKKIVELTEQSSLQIEVIEKDVMANDAVGNASIDNVIAGGRPYSEIEFATTGQLQRATVTFVPVAGGSPAVAAPAEP